MLKRDRCKWINSCNTTTSLADMVNRGPSSFFQGFHKAQIRGSIISITVYRSHGRAEQVVGKGYRVGFVKRTESGIG